MKIREIIEDMKYITGCDIHVDALIIKDGFSIMIHDTLERRYKIIYIYYHELSKFNTTADYMKAFEDTNWHDC